MTKTQSQRKSPEKKKKDITEELERVKRYFYEETLRKDTIIRKLKEENMVILAASVRQAKRMDELNQKIIELEKKVK